MVPCACLVERVSDCFQNCVLSNCRARCPAWPRGSSAPLPAWSTPRDISLHLWKSSYWYPLGIAVWTPVPPCKSRSVRARQAHTGPGGCTHGLSVLPTWPRCCALVRSCTPASARHSSVSRQDARHSLPPSPVDPAGRSQRLGTCGTYCCAARGQATSPALTAECFYERELSWKWPMKATHTGAWM